MNTHHITNLLLNFYRAHYGAIFLIAILSQFGLIRFLWNTIQFAGSLIYLGYAYIVVGCQKLKTSKKNKLADSTSLI